MNKILFYGTAILLALVVTGFVGVENEADAARRCRRVRCCQPPCAPACATVCQPACAPACATVCQPACAPACAAVVCRGNAAPSAQLIGLKALSFCGACTQDSDCGVDHKCCQGDCPKGKYKCYRVDVCP